MASTHEQRITALRETITTSESRITELNVQRQAALAGDDDTIVDKIDVELAMLSKRIQLSNERIVVAEAAEREAAELAEQDKLDAIAARADKARKLGEALLPEYAGASLKLASILSKLSAIDNLIRESNQTLSAAGRDVIASPNAMRCKPLTYLERTERRLVGIGEPEHPMHGKVRHDLNGNAYDENGQAVPTFDEFDVTVRNIVPMVTNAPVQDEVKLPAATIDGQTIWPRTVDHAAVLRELELDDSKPSVLKRALSRIA